ncbi:MAG: hypothetical protein J6D33_02200 [Turicibacter sp.]|nr:hypothetical protein [Turicibacter sp.]
MELKIYQLKYPSHLSLKKELNQQGLRPIEAKVAIFKNEKGHSYDLYDKTKVTALTLQDLSGDLTLWRSGLLAKQPLTDTQQELIYQIETVVKQRVVDQYPNQEEVTLETLYFNNEYPVEKMGKPSELSRKGLKGIRKIGAYINADKCSPLYEWESAVPLDMKTATKRELEYWREGVLMSDSDSSEEAIHSLLESLDIEIQNRNGRTRISKKTSSKKKESGGVAWQHLKQYIVNQPESYAIVSVVGSGIFSTDETLQVIVLSLGLFAGNLGYSIAEMKANGLFLVYLSICF